MQDAYPELTERQEVILNAVRQEETLFRRTLQNGLARLDDEMATGELSGKRAFYLYETFGLPFEITRELALEKGIEIDRAGYDAAEDEARERSRAASDLGGTWESVSDETKALYRSLPLTKFVGYKELEIPAHVLGIVVDGEPKTMVQVGQAADILLDVSPFYAESGGQVGDAGVIRTADGVFTVTDTKKQNGLWFHRGIMASGVLHVGDSTTADVTTSRRRDIQRNHTATHLLHKALRSRLGSHVQQRGSLVAPDKLRFDFAHGMQVTETELRDIETEVNTAILNELPVDIAEKPKEEAQKMGAMMLFGEKYGDTVRVVSIGGEYSREFCGGTHVANTAQIGPFRLMSEGSAAAGVRRIEAITGRGADEQDRESREQLKHVAQLLSVRPEGAPDAVEKLLANLKATQEALTKAKQAQTGNQAAQLVEAARSIGGLSVVIAAPEGIEDGNALSALADDILGRLKSGVVVLAAVSGDKLLFVAKAAKDAVGKGVHAGNIVKAAATASGGGGGGKPDFAQAGGARCFQTDRGTRGSRGNA